MGNNNTVVLLQQIQTVLHKHYLVPLGISYMKELQQLIDTLSKVRVNLNSALKPLTKDEIYKHLSERSVDKLKGDNAQ